MEQVVTKDRLAYVRGGSFMPVTDGMKCILFATAIFGEEKNNKRVLYCLRKSKKGKVFVYSSVAKVVFF